MRTGMVRAGWGAAIFGLALGGSAAAQQQAPPAAGSARATAPFDLTGVWVSVVTEDWRWRMTTPAKGDTLGIPVNPTGQKATDAWDYARDSAAGNQCKAYGAGGIMRMPTRLRIGWQDDNTLKVETDAGQQTKLLHFDRTPAAGPRTLQGHSAAQWVDVFGAGRAGGRGGGGGGGGGGGRGAPPAYGTGALRVVTTNLSDGYLRKNGVPYSQNAVVTEYFDRVPGPDDAQWLIVKTTVEDAAYLAQPYLSSAHFMREADASKWRPSACEVDPPLVPTKSDVR
jgi:hypothetical protein